MSEGWIVFAVIAFSCALFGAQIYAVVKVARRLMGIFKGYSEPGKLAELLTPETRQMLQQRGIDPATLTSDFEALNDAPEVRERVAADVRAAVTRAFRLRGASVVAGSETDATRRDGTHWPDAHPKPEAPRMPEIPEAFDAQQQGGGRRTLAIALGAGLAVAVLARLLGWA